MREPREQTGLGRRKACDACCRRKIRCDAGVPKCAACIAHGSTCVWTPGLHAAKAMKTPDVSSINSRRISHLERRLAAIEGKLRHVDTPEASPTAMEQHYEQQLPNAMEEPNSPIAIDRSGSTPSQSPASPGEKDDGFALPPKDTVYKLVDEYFYVSPAMSLFDAVLFKPMLEDWYQFPDRRNEASWASINVVLALSLQQSSQTDDRLSLSCIRNAQSVMNQLVIRDEDVKGLQVVLGLVILFLGTPSPQPACVLIATAVKLTHRLQLHLREGRQGTNPELVAQKERLLWITYILDRDISMRTVEPYSLQDHDMEVDENSFMPSAAAYTFAWQDQQRENEKIFNLRLQLAHVQGKMYDLVHSVRARKLTAQQQKLATQQLTHLLESWFNSVPDGFRTVDLSSKTSAHLLRQLIPLHLAYYLCLFTAHRLQLRFSSWMNSLTEYSKRLVSPGITSVASDSQSSVPMLPSNWLKFVEAARSSLRLVQQFGLCQPAILWGTACTQQVALVILIANNLTVSEHLLHDQIEADSQLIDEALMAFEGRVRAMGKDDMQSDLLSACQKLRDQSRLAVLRLREAQSIVPSLHEFYSLDLVLGN